MTELAESQEDATPEAMEATHPSAVAIALGRTKSGGAADLDAAAAAFLIDQYYLSGAFVLK